MNDETFKAAGVSDQITPLHVEAPDFPFADNFFDAVVCIDAYMYFGLDPAFLGDFLAPKLKTGGRLILANPGWTEAAGDRVPDVLRPWITEEMGFHTPKWWTRHLEIGGHVRVVRNRELECHREAWEDWLLCDNEHARQDISMMEADGYRWLSTIGIEGVKASRG